MSYLAAHPLTTTLVTMLLVAALVIVLIRVNNAQDRAFNARCREGQERERCLRHALGALSYTCDGRSLTISRSESWNDDEHVMLEIQPQMRQVFRIAVPGHAPFEHCHPVDRGISPRLGVALPGHFDRPQTVEPYLIDLTTAAQVREDILPRLAATMNLDQTRLDATTIELAGHQLRYHVRFNYRDCGTTRWTDYRPDLSKETLTHG